MKIVFFIGNLGRGGAERVISLLANHFVDIGHDVDIALLLEGTVGYPIDHRVRIIDMYSSRKSSYIKSLPGWIKKIRGYIAKEKPDRIVSFIGRINVLVLTACAGKKIPITVSERNDPRRDGRSGFMLRLCNRKYHKARNIVFQNKYQQSCFSDDLSDRSVIIGNPVSVSVHAQPNEQKIIAAAGRLVRQKNYIFLVRAFGKLCETDHDAVLKIYGDGPLRSELNDEIDRLGLTERVELCGNVTDLHERLAGVSAFVMTSEYEGMSNALIEAMMIGLPCISTDYPGVRELITDEENGIIVPLGDSDALAAAMQRVIGNKELSDKLRKNASLSSEKYKTDNTFREWEKIIINQEICK